MPTEKGKEWNHVTVIELKDKLHQHKVECKYCNHVFVGGASRIRERFPNINPACGVAKCTAEEAVRQPVLDEMRAIDAQNKAAAGTAAAQHQLDRRVAANASRTEVNFSFVHSDSRNRLTTSRACKMVWPYSNLRLAERTQSLEQGLQAQTLEVFSDDEERQGSDADNSSSDE